jgi:hypothetical protein
MVTILQVSASTYAQKINLDVQKAPLEDVLLLCSSKAGTIFCTARSLIKMAEPVSLSLKNVSINRSA